MSALTAASDDSASNMTSSSLDSSAVADSAPQWVYYSASAAFVAIAVPGVALNAVALYVYAIDQALHTPFNVILMTLVVVELCCAAFALPLNAAAAASLGWVFGQPLCAATAFITATAGICSISLLSLLGIQRWLFVAFPSHTPRFNSPSFCYSLLALGWAYTAAVIIGPFLSGWAGFKPECLGISCGPIWDDPSKLSYTVYLLIMGYVIPMATVIASSIGLVINMKKRSAEMQLASLKSAMAKKELRVTRMVVAMIVAFVLVWSPYAVSAIVVIVYSIQEGDERHQQAANFLKGSFAPLPVIFAKMSTFINPILYVVLNPQFQRSFKKVVLKREEDSSNNKDLQTRKTIMMDNNGKAEVFEDEEEEEEEEVYAGVGKNAGDGGGGIELKIINQQ